MLQVGPPALHYYCAVVLHSCIVLPPVGHPSNHEYRCCHLKRHSSCVSNFYRTFKFFIWLSLVLTEVNFCTVVKNVLFVLYPFVMKPNLMHCLSSVYFVNQPVHVSGIFVAHHHEVYCIYTAIGTCCAVQLTVCTPVPNQPGQQTVN